MDLLNTLILIIGSYTLAPDSDGIYVYSFNQENGEAQRLSTNKIENPSYLTFSPDKKTLFALQEVPKNSIATSYTINRASGRLTENITQQTKGGDACFIANNGEIVITANYSGGSLTVFPITPNGELLPATQTIQFSGGAANKESYKGARPDRQQLPHLHSVYFAPQQNFIFAADLGNDCIYRFNLKGNKIDTQSKYIIQTPSGSGPRHIAFSDNGDSFYIINEISGTILLYSDIYSTPQLQQEAPVVPQEDNNLGTYGCADIHISPCSNYLYASQRVKNEGIAIFKIDKITSKLERVGFQPTGGHPRNFAITPNGNFLLVASRDNNNIEVYNIDKETGLLTLCNIITNINKPVCINILN